jgi:hypothetical protein
LIDRLLRWRVFPGFLLWVVLATLPGSVAGATGLLDEAPTIAPFGTAHVRIAGTVYNQGQELPVQGDGDIDATRGASHLTVGVLGAVFETIVLNGRTYTRNLATGRWEYTEGTQAGGFNPALLAPYDPATIRAAGSNFTRIGPEPVDGTPATHWRADADLARLLGIPAGAGTPGLAATPATMDLWIGDADNRLRRLGIDSRGTAPGTATATSGSPRFTLTLTFSNFDEPVPILAPPGAVPAATPGATPAGGGPFGLPAGRATSTASGGVVAVAPAPSADPAAAQPSGDGRRAPDSTLLSRVLASTALVILVLVGLLTAWHRRARQVAPREDSSSGEAEV